MGPWILLSQRCHWFLSMKLGTGLASIPGDWSWVSWGGVTGFHLSLFILDVLDTSPLFSIFLLATTVGQPTDCASYSPLVSLYYPLSS